MDNLYRPGVKLHELEREAILEALRYHGGNRTAAAKDLGVSTRTIQNRVSQYLSEGHDVPAPACARAIDWFSPLPPANRR